MLKPLSQKIAALAAAAAISATALTALPRKAEAFDFIGAAINMVAAASQAKQTSAQLDYLDGEGRNEMYGQIRQQYGVNGDPDLNYKLDRIMAELNKGVAAVDGPIDPPYQYFVNSDESFNAFCTLGHNISVNSGLFKMIDSPDEIAVVIGHEMAHGQQNHVKSGFKKKSTLSVISAGIAGGSSIGIALAANILNTQVSAHNVTKPQEKEADALAFTYLTHTKYNLGATAAIWQRVIDQSGSDKQNLLGSIFSPSDHPGHESRRDAYAETLSEYSGNVMAVADGVVSVNSQPLVVPAGSEAMSSAERSYFVAGSLARALHDGGTKQKAHHDGHTVKLGKYEIMTAITGDEEASVIAARLNDLLKLPTPKAGKKKKKKNKE